jgi:hypothetical protein
MSWKTEVQDIRKDPPSSSGAGKWILESTTSGQLVSFHGQLFQGESRLMDATVGTPERKGGFQNSAPLMMVTSDGEMFVGDVINCEMHRCKSSFEVGFNFDAVLTRFHVITSLSVLRSNNSYMYVFACRVCR